MKDKYSLEIYNPGSGYDVWVSFTSETPFQAISKGDIINTFSFPDANSDESLRVVNVEHIIWALPGGDAKHKVCVYTDKIDNLQEQRTES